METEKINNYITVKIIKELREKEHLNIAFEIFKDELAKGEKVSVAGFGIFKITERKARDGRNPLTGKKIKIKASKSVNFKLSTAIKDKIN